MLTKNAQEVLNRIIKVYVAATKRTPAPAFPEMIADEESLQTIQGDFSSLQLIKLCHQLMEAEKITFSSASGDIFLITLSDQTIAEYEHRFLSALKSIGGVVEKVANLADLATSFPEIFDAITSLRDTNQ